jgi:hypothetical protein
MPTSTGKMSQHSSMPITLPATCSRPRPPRSKASPPHLMCKKTCLILIPRNAASSGLRSQREWCFASTDAPQAVRFPLATGARRRRTRATHRASGGDRRQQRAAAIEDGSGVDRGTCARADRTGRREGQRLERLQWRLRCPALASSKSRAKFSRRTSRRCRRSGSRAGPLGTWMQVCAAASKAVFGAS